MVYAFELLSARAFTPVKLFKGWGMIDKNLDNPASSYNVG